ncbi:MAG: entericidin [Planctomycetota bacterium]
MRPSTRNPISFRVAALVLGSALGLGMTATLSGCNAVEGLGEDLQESSENVREAVRDDEPEN